MQVKFKLGRARKMYLRRLLERGLSGCDIQEVAETVFNRGLQECVPAEWMREAVERAERRALLRKR